MILAEHDGTVITKETVDWDEIDPFDPPGEPQLPARPPAEQHWDLDQIPLPDGIRTLYPTQINAVQKIMDAFSRVDLVVLSGPTGSGKSFIGWAVAYLQAWHRTAYLCSDKNLQDQFLSDFGPLGARTIKGRANYIPQNPEEVQVDGTIAEVTCADCDFSPKKNSCTFCPVPKLCPYTVAKREAREAPVAILNYAYFLNETLSPHSAFTGNGLVIADECDVLENQLLSFRQVTYSQNLRRRLGLGQPHRLDDESGDSWVDWLQNKVMPALAAETKRSKGIPKATQRRRALRHLAKLRAETNMLIEKIPEGAWVLDGYKRSSGRKPKDGPLIFRPVKVDQIGQEYLFPHGKKWLLMSATPINPSLMIEEIGWEEGWEHISTPMPIPRQSRPIHAVPVGEMTQKKEEETLPAMIRAVNGILHSWGEERAVIHTVSYKRMNTIADSIVGRRHVFTYTGSAEKELVLRKFEKTPRSVLIGPSIGRGVDLKGDMARVNIILKMPYPYLGDKRVAKRARLSDGDEWYATQTIRELVQMCGRTTRGAGDWSYTYILDSRFFDVYNRWSKLFPDWWKEALDFTITPNQLLKVTHTGE